MTDAQLIEQHRKGSQDAFAELVRRHVDWVYSAARRRVGDSHLADDIAQAAFIALAKKKPRLWTGSSLAPWLLTVVNLSCKAALRSESTRRRHETKAATMRSEIEAQQGVMWEELSPHLDELVERLGRADRTAVMLRFYQQKSFAEVGAALGISEEAARKRTSRAVEQLRTVLAGRGVGMSAGTLSTLLLAETAKPAPFALSGTITAVSTTGAVTAMTLAKGAIAIMAWTKIKITAVFVIAVLLLVGGGAGIAVHFLSGGPMDTPRVAEDTVVADPLPLQVGEYYVGGHVQRTGVYSLTGREITVRAAIISAGMLDSATVDDWAVSLIRKEGSRGTTIILDSMPLPKLFPAGPDVVLKGDDQLTVLPAAQLNDQPLSWRPVREMSFSSADEQKALNFDSGTITSVPDQLDWKQRNDQFVDRVRTIGADALISKNVLVILRVPTDKRTDSWESISPLLVRQQLRTQPTPSNLRESFYGMTLNGLSNVVVFRSREGWPGMIQVMEPTGDGTTFRVRYCIGKTTPVSQPAH